MLDYIWSFMLLAGFAVAIMTGRLEETTAAALTGAGDAVTMCIGLLGVMCLWCGIMKIAEKSGLIRALSKLLHPIMHQLFPDIPSDSPAMGAMVMNIAANLLGLANAATPLGLHAMQELQKHNKKPSTASNAMVLFVVINTASLTLIPTTIIGLRTQNLSQNATEIISAVWITSTCVLLVGVIAAKLLEKGTKGGRTWKS